jgi:hypothetical protein
VADYSREGIANLNAISAFEKYLEGAGLLQEGKGYG